MMAHTHTCNKTKTTRKNMILSHKHMSQLNCLLSCVMIWFRITLNLSHTHTHTYDYAEWKNLMCRFYVWCHFTFIFWTFFLPLCCYYYFFLLSAVCDLRHIMRSESLIGMCVCVCALARESIGHTVP